MLIPQETVSFKNNSNIRFTRYMNLKNLAHWHNEMELIFIDKGPLQVTINKNMYIGNTGDCFLCESGDIHYMIGESGSTASIIQFSENLIKITKKHRINSPIVRGYSAAKDGIEKIITEMTAHQGFYTTYVQNIIENIVIDMYRKNGFIVESSFSYNHVLLKYRELMEYIDNNYSNITFKQASQIMAFTPSYFSKVFAQLCGTTFSSFLNAVKVEKSIQLIKSSNKNITEIAIECGFGSIRHFNRVFKELTGFSPKNIPENYIFDANQIKVLKSDFNPTHTETKIILECD